MRIAGWTRRDLFKSPLVASLLGSLGWGGRHTVAASQRVEAAYANNIYTRMFGVTPVIGAAGALSSYGNSRMRPDVIRAMTEASDFLVDLDELNRAAGRRIAEIMKAEAAMVTSCAAGSMMLGAAACLTGTDREKIDALPHPTWPRRVCLMQKAHRFLYDRAYRAAGMTIVDVETKDQLIAAIDGTTAMIAGLAGLGATTGLGGGSSSVISIEELVAIGKKANVPVLIDAAGQLPPVSNLTLFTGMGADLVCFSGGKALGGPSSTGILAGRKDLIEAAMLNGSPNQNVGRGMKLNREEIVGLVVALEGYLKIDHQKGVRRVDAEVAVHRRSAAGYPRIEGDGDPHARRLFGGDARLGSEDHSADGAAGRRPAQGWEAADRLLDLPGGADRPGAAARARGRRRSHRRAPSAAVLPGGSANGEACGARGRRLSR